MFTDPVNIMEIDPDLDELPFVSVVIPAYNASRTVVDCVRSVFDQDYPRDRFEVIVVDNNSVDGTDRAAREAGAVVCYETEYQSPEAARNQGVRAARGEIIAFTDSDCVIDSDWLTRIVSPFSNPSIGGVVGAILDGESNTLVEEITHRLAPFRPITVDGLAATLTCNSAFRRSVVQQLGYFDETLFTSADVDLGWRIQLSSDYRIVYDMAARVVHHHRTSISGLFRQYQRYGYGEILLATLFKDRHLSGFKPEEQYSRIFSQVKSLMIYKAAFIKRIITYPLKKRDPFTSYEPLLLWVTEYANLNGKLHALIETKGLRQNPFASRSEIVRQRSGSEDRNLP